ncbi:MAG: AIDA repeat-containing protein, partial [Lentisphaeria bacterium]|nr:AIDA repeat-containing protein [Lentisphaeria bacterium]
MNQQTIANGGVQYVPQIEVQYVYLDFDGELTCYNGEILTVDYVEVADSQLTQTRIRDIVAELNALYADRNVIFVTEKPTVAEYSTIYIGKTSAFDSYGNFAGLAETIDKGNKISNDKAFVMLDSNDTNARIISTISHETDHLLGVLEHGGSALAAYAAVHNVSAGVTSNGVVLSSGHSMSVLSNGVANNTIVNSWGFIYVSGGGIANLTTVNSEGRMFVSNGGIANSTTVKTGGDVFIASGGTATNIIWTPCAGRVNVENGAHVTYLSKYSGVYFGSEGKLISSALAMNEKTVSGTIYVMSSGTASKTTVNWGAAYVYEGGAVNSTGIYNNGSMNIYKGGVADITTVGVNGKMYISSGGTANSTTVSGGLMNIRDGGFASNTEINNGSMAVSSGGTVERTIVNSGGSMLISRGGTANSTTVNESGYMRVQSGGVASSTTVNSGGSMLISSGGTANKTVVNESGYMRVISGGEANDTTVNSGGSMHISRGGVVNGTVVNFAGDMFIYSSGIANNTTVKDNANMTVFGGGSANQTTVEHGNMTIRGGGVVRDTVINAGGNMYIGSGCIHRGSLQLAGDAVVSAYAGSIIDFILTDRTVENDYLINNLSLISGAPTYTVTVSAVQKFGTYKLAQGAGNFSATVSIGNGTVVYGSTTANGTMLSYNNTDYILECKSGDLTLKIGDFTPPVAPVVNADITAATNQDVTITASFSEDTARKQYCIGDGEWQDYTGKFTVSENGTVIFRAEDAAGNAITKKIVISNIDKKAPGTPAVFDVIVSGNKAVLHWSDVIDKGIAGVEGYYIRYGTSNTLIGEGEFINASEFNVTGLTAGMYFYQIKTLDKAGNMSEWSAVHCFNVDGALVPRHNLSWDTVSGAEGYTLEYSVDNFTTAITLEVDTNTLDCFALPSGTYQWRVKAENGEFMYGKNIVSESVVKAQELVSDADGNLDVFFANGKSTWGKGYFAQHQGDNSTGEEVELFGKNRITDVFAGSSDANILVMTDDTNGDALFLDDVYTALGEQARLSQINEIRAGAGNDIIDMTSSQFEYNGSEMTIYGGLGDDVIWAAGEDNDLFGDAGD